MYVKHLVALYHIFNWMFNTFYCKSKDKATNCFFRLLKNFTFATILLPKKNNCTLLCEKNMKWVLCLCLSTLMPLLCIKAVCCLIWLQSTIETWVLICNFSNMLWKPDFLPPNEYLIIQGQTFFLQNHNTY